MELFLDFDGMLELWQFLCRKKGAFHSATGKALSQEECGNCVLCLLSPRSS